MSRGGAPVFDEIFLGVGNDGHTASIFPGHSFKDDLGKVCITTTSPSGVLSRISLSSWVISSALHVSFILLDNKKEIFKKMLSECGKKDTYPALNIFNMTKDVHIYLPSNYLL